LWTSIERLSWLVAIIGFPAAIAGLFLSYWQLILLRREQKRIAAQLAKSADLRVGFVVPIEPNLKTPMDDEPIEITVAPPVLVDTLDAVGVLQPDGSVIVDVRIATYNAGALGTRSLLWNYVLLPLGVEAVTAGTTWTARRDPEGPFRLMTTSDHLHPDVVEPHTMRLRVAEGITRILVHYSVRSDETRAKRGLLTVRLAGPK
jgi:hypothetical protein